MKLEEWLQALRSAAQPMDSAALAAGAQRIAARAQSLTGNQAVFHVTATGAGVRISAFPPSPLARRALDRAVGEQIGSLREDLGRQGRERLTVG